MPLIASLFFCLPAYANNAGQSSNGGGHEDDGNPPDMSMVTPIDDLIARVQTKYKGSILNIKLESEDGTWRYEVKMLSSEGRVMKLEYDAQTLDLLKVKGKGRGADDDAEEEGGHSYWKRLIHKFD